MRSRYLGKAQHLKSFGSNFEAFFQERMVWAFSINLVPAAGTRFPIKKSGELKQFQHQGYQAMHFNSWFGLGFSKNIGLF